MRKGEELKAPRYASAAAIRDYITAYDIIPKDRKSTRLNSSHYLQHSIDPDSN